MPDILTVRYAQTGRSTKQNPMGMREMQARAYEKRNEQYLLLKAPPASGKSRALMFIALDKVIKQGLDKVIVAVPEMAIGGSFKDTDLTSHGFFADWHVNERYNLCTPGNEGKVDRVVEFMNQQEEHYLLCTHSTFRYAYSKIGNASVFNKTLVAIDEFHHASVEEGNILGAIVDDLMAHSRAHIVAMTGSYFRGDAVPILLPEDEAKFTQVTYTYYEQLNGYKYLKSLGIGYHFYQGRYFDALKEVLDPNKKTIVHIPNVNSLESTGRKIDEVDRILDVLGTVQSRDQQTGIYRVKTHEGKIIFVADLVTDDAMRVNVLNYLRNIKNASQMDTIIALGMAKEGFDWPWCEHVLTIGYRSSLTEIIQIIGRATRDCPGKTHAQFTNLIAQPDAEDEDVRTSVNNMLKAITVSLLMEQVLAPNITFKPRSLMSEGEKPKPGTIVIDDKDHPVSARVQNILQNGGIQDVITSTLQDTKVVGPMIANAEPPQLFNAEELPKVVTRLYPDLTPEEVRVVADAAHTEMVIHSNGGLVDAKNLPKGFVVTQDDDSGHDDGERDPAESGKQFLRVGEKFINIEKLNIDLIAQINPFQGAYEVLSKSVNAPMLKTIQDLVVANRSGVSAEEAVLLWPNVQEFAKEHGMAPSLQSGDPYERRLAEVLAFMRRKKAEQMMAQN
ncbi:MAG: Helicase ATP-binding domain-containing protein [Burkholderia sp.]|jgi:hypothetical protein